MAQSKKAAATCCAGMQVTCEGCIDVASSQRSRSSANNEPCNYNNGLHGLLSGSYNITFRHTGIQFFVMDNVSSMESKTLAITMHHPFATIEEVKEEIQRKRGILPKDQLLIYHSRPLEDGCSITSCGIVPQSLLTLRLREPHSNGSANSCAGHPVHAADFTGTAV